MKIIYERNENLPKLAWLANIIKKENRTIVYCGLKVECDDDFFVAGVWDGDFKKHHFDSSEVFYGTGCLIKDDELVFCTPSHALQRLVLFENEDSILVSNSCSFLMAKGNCKLCNTIDQYEKIFCSVLDGPEKMVQYIPLENQKQMRQVIVGMIRVNNNGDIHIERRQKQKLFSNFDEYENRIVEMLKRLKANFSSIDRVYSHFGVVSTISSGYDSSCCSALAKEIGCDTVCSLTGGQYDVDSGFEIAKQLKYENIVCRGKTGYQEKENDIDAEFLADGEMGTGLQFSVFEDVFEDNIVVMGLRGSYWDKFASMTEDFEMIGYFNCESDTSFTEHSLKHGYIVLPLPTFGASVCNSIFAISNSEEMQPWSIGGNYDKPIPRRLLESRGVNRQSFGQVKYGGGFSFSRDNKVRLKKRMSAEGYKSFNRYLLNGNGCRKSLRRFFNVGKYIFLNLPSYFNYAFSKLNINISLKQKPERFANSGIVADLIFWGTDVMIERYATVLTNLKKK